MAAALIKPAQAEANLEFTDRMQQFLGRAKLVDDPGNAFGENKLQIHIAGISRKLISTFFILGNCTDRCAAHT